MDRQKPRQIVRWNLSFAGRLHTVAPLRVVAHGPDGLLLWLADGSTVLRADAPGARPPRTIPPGAPRPAAPPMRPARWERGDALILHPPGAGHAVWWCWSARSAPGGRRFTGWRVALEHRTYRAGEIHVADRGLGVAVAPDRSWRWEGEEPFAAWTGRPGGWTAARAAAIRAAGRRVATLAGTGGPPFDGRWTDFEPPADWGAPALPEPPGTTHRRRAGRPPAADRPLAPV